MHSLNNFTKVMLMASCRTGKGKGKVLNEQQVTLEVKIGPILEGSGYNKIPKFQGFE